MRRRWWAGPGTRVAISTIAALAAALFGTGETRAAGPAARFTLDNDQFNFWENPNDRPDFGYTHGTEIALHFPEAPHAIARFAPAWLIGSARAGGKPASLELILRQSIYGPYAYPPDRPFAGWLEAAVGVTRSGEHESRNVLLHLGVTGPPSLAGSVHRYFHRRFDRRDPLPDWSHQLPFEPGIGVETNLSRTVQQVGEPEGWREAMGPFVRARLGTYAVDLRLGMNLSLGLAPSAPWPEAAPATGGPSVYLRASPHLDLIARDEFLDGTLFRPSQAPGAKAIVPESEAAAGAGWGHLRIEWAVHRRGKEFETQPILHTYSSLSVQWLP